MQIFSSPYPAVPQRDQSITERVFEGLKDRPNEIVLTNGLTGETHTAQDFMTAVKAIAGGLTQRGLVKGHTIALMAPNSPEWCMVFHGIALAGATITTLNPVYTEQEIQEQLIGSSAKILITAPESFETAKAAIKGTNVSEIFLIGSSDKAPSIEKLKGPPLESQAPVDLDKDILVLPYSSGTTGVPKGVMLSHRNLVINVDQSLTILPVAPGETTIAFLPFFHIYGMNILMNMYLAAKASLVTIPRFDLEHFLTLTQNHKVKRLLVVPPIVLALAKQPLVDDFDLSNLKELVSGAAPLGSEISSIVSNRLDCKMLQAYGMTELSPVTHCNPVNAPRLGSVGLTVPNTSCRIVSTETGADLDQDQEGELWIQGPQVMIGYLNNKEATQQTIDQDGWLHTGDIGYFDKDGYLFIVDRLKELIKYKGFQIAPAELEALLLAHEKITDVAVIGIPDTEAGEIPIAFIVTQGEAPSLQEIQNFLEPQVATYKQIQHIKVIETIPKSASGKILRRLLRDTIT